MICILSLVSTVIYSNLVHYTEPQSWGRIMLTPFHMNVYLFELNHRASELFVTVLI